MDSSATTKALVNRSKGNYRQDLTTLLTKLKPSEVRRPGA